MCICCLAKKQEKLFFILMNIRSFKLQSSGLLGKINCKMRYLASFLPLKTTVMLTSEIKSVTFYLIYLILACSMVVIF